MRGKIGWALAVVAIVLLPATLALGRGGGGGGHGGGGGGHGGGGHGGGGHGGGGHSFGGGGGGRSFSGGGGGSSARSFNGGGGSGAKSFSGGGGNSVRSFSGGNGGTGGPKGQSFVNKNFAGTPGNHLGGNNHTGSNAIHHQVNRINTGNTLNRNNSFIHQQNITSKDAKSWTHNNGNNNWTKNHSNQNAANWNKHNGNGNWNKGNWNNGNWNNWNHHHGGGGFWPWWGFGGIGLGGWGWGWPYYGWGYGYGYPLYNNYGYGGYGYANNYAYADAPVDSAVAANLPSGEEFADQGEADFKAGQYQAAARDWQHAMVDDPQNGALMMLMAQALFAMGRYDEAAGATQAGMQMLPEDKWGVVIANYTQLYGNVQDYTDQLKALEKARDAKPDSPALRFLLGFHFGYLGYPKQAVRELDKGLTLAPRDLGARKVRDLFAAKWPEAPPLPEAAVKAQEEMEKENAQGAPGGPAPAGGTAPAPPAPNPPAPAGAPQGTPS